MSQADSYDVFLSHNSADKTAVEVIAKKLEAEGLCPWIDKWHLVPGEAWQPAIEEALKQCKTCAVFIGASGQGAWQLEEMRAAIDRRVKDREGKFRVIPVLLPGAERVPLSSFLTAARWVEFRDTIHDKHALHLLCSGIRGLPPGDADSLPDRSLPRFSLERLPYCGEDLINRKDELNRLDEAWKNSQEHIISVVARGGEGKTWLVGHWYLQLASRGFKDIDAVFTWSFYNQGTSERAASADYFMNQALEFFGDPQPAAGSSADKGMRLAALVGGNPTPGQLQAADNPAAPASARPRPGAKNLLILDGLEPLQVPVSTMGGDLKDPGLKSLLKGLRDFNLGLCVITTRQEVKELAGGKGSVCPKIELKALTPEAGAKLLAAEWELEDPRFQDLEADLQAVSKDFAGHALSLSLLGRYFKAVPGGDVSEASEVSLLVQDALEGGHAFRVLASYEKWLTGGYLVLPRKWWEFWDKSPDVSRQELTEIQRLGGQMLSVLRVLGLFDRPATAAEMAFLREKTAIKGLTEPIVGLSEDQWNRTLFRLRELGLMSGEANNEQGGGECQQPKSAALVDCHPLIREYFAKRLADDASSTGDDAAESSYNPAREGHRRLFNRITQSIDGVPRTLEKMMPLCHAVAHACKAGDYQKAYELYTERVFPKKHLRDRLGAVSENIRVLSNFIEKPWTKAVDGLSPKRQAAVLTNVGLDLRFLGRLDEARQGMQSGLDCSIAQSDWEGAANSARHLTQLDLITGEMDSALALAERSVYWAHLAAKLYERVFTRATVGDLLFQLGKTQEARSAFEDAERVQQHDEPEHPLLYRLPGYRYCCLLLDNGDYSEVIRRVDAARNWEPQQEFVVGLLLHEVVLGQAQAKQGDVEAGRKTIIQAVTKLRKQDRPQFLVIGLLAEAASHREARDFSSCETFLAEVESILSWCPMLLWEIEVTLEKIKLAMATGNRTAAQHHLNRTQELIKRSNRKFDPPAYGWDKKWTVPAYLGVSPVGQTVGYRRRDTEIISLQQKINGMS